MTDLQIRRARPTEAGDIAALVRASITELCVDDHGGNRAKIDSWLENKTKAHLDDWLTRPEMAIYVMNAGGDLAAAGCHNERGIVLMNYIAPAHRFRGISSAMLIHLEDGMRSQGICEPRLVSTATARRFYETRGWQAYGEVIPCMGVTGQPMRKRLA